MLFFPHFAISQALSASPLLARRELPVVDSRPAACFSSSAPRVSCYLKSCMFFLWASAFSPVGCRLPRLPSHSACSCHLSAVPSCHLSCVAHWICFVASMACSHSGLAMLQGILSWPFNMTLASRWSCECVEEARCDIDGRAKPHNQIEAI